MDQNTGSRVGLPNGSEYEYTTEVDLTLQEVRVPGDWDGPRRGVLLHAMHWPTPGGLPLGICVGRGIESNRGGLA